MQAVGKTKADMRFYRYIYITHKLAKSEERKNMRKIFEPGRTVITTNAMNTLRKDDVLKAFSRHLKGDWGRSRDKEANDAAVENEDNRIVSVYRDGEGVKFWIITEADRSVTTILLPEDY